MPRRTTSAPAVARTLLWCVTVAALAALVVVGVVAGVRSAGRPVAGPSPTSRPGPTRPGPTGPPLSGRVPSDHPCARHGLDPARLSATGPTYALVRGSQGRVRAVSFARGWDVHQGRRPGVLVAVCEAPRAGAGRPSR